MCRTGLGEQAEQVRGYLFAAFAYFADGAYAGGAALFAWTLGDEFGGSAGEIGVHAVEGGALAYASGVAVVEEDGCRGCTEP